MLSVPCAAEDSTSTNAKSENAGPTSFVLLIEDNDADADAVLEALRKARVTRVSRLADGLQRLAADNIDVVVLDLSLPDASGLGGLRRVRLAAPAVPVIVLSGSRDNDLCAQALHEGAQEYLVKGDLDDAGVAQRVRDAFERQRYVTKAARLAQEQSRRAAAEDAQRRAAWLAEAGRLLSSSLDLEATMANIARAAVPSFADGCIIELADRHQPSGQAVLTSAQARRLHDAIRTGRSWCDETGAANVLVVPMAVGARLVGAIELSHSTSARRFDRADCYLGEAFGHRAALALENADLYQRARAAVSLRDDFVSIASHELRTPLSTLQLQLQILQLKSKGEATLAPAELAERLEKCLAQTGRLARLVDTLLDVSLIASGQITLSLEELDLAAVVREAMQRLLAESAGDTPLVFEDVEHVPGRWDRLRIEQVLTNLITNGVKYGAGRPVKVALRADQTHAVLTVRDGGIGIAAADLRRIFGRFERAAPARNYSGLGLGLYVTRQIVEAHGGTITVESEPGVGSLFTVRLPLAGPPPPSPAGPAS